MTPIHKFNNGNLATLCHTCRTIICEDHTHDLFCKSCLENKELCDCGNVATWCYMPGYKDNSNPHHCDNCVPRGCTCNHNYLAEEFENKPEGEEGKDWKWIEKDTCWCYIDDEGREMPCVEYWYDEEGWDKDNMEITLTYDEFEEIKQKMFLEGFKASGEGYNGEHPPRTDEEMWKSIKEDYDKIK